jgi:hypothetical protein
MAGIAGRHGDGFNLLVLSVRKELLSTPGFSARP